MIFEIKNLHAEIEGKSVLKGVNLTVRSGEVHAIMGRNGTGKTTLSQAIMGHPRVQITQGDLVLDGISLIGMSPEDRARARVFLAFQYPVAVPGVSVASFLRATLKAVRGNEIPPSQVRSLIREELKRLSIPESFMMRSLNDGFSGGEKKRLETLQMRLLQPKIAVLDETDSGLDIDALRVVSENIEAMRDSTRGMIVITHYQRMLNYIKPDYVHVFDEGQIVASGDATLALKLESEGYDGFRGRTA